MIVTHLARFPKLLGSSLELFEQGRGDHVLLSGAS